MTTILEGTWEEIVAHAPELSGKRLQVLVLEEQSTESEAEKQARLRAVLMSRIGVIKGGPTDLSERAKELWGVSVEKKWQDSQR